MTRSDLASAAFDFILLALVIWLSLGRTCNPIVLAQDHDDVILEAALQHALLSRLTIWVKRDGDPIYVGHCREARDGCEQRIATYVDAFISAAREYNIDPWILAAMAVRESSLNPQAVGSVGETGLFQFHPRGHAARRVRRACKLDEDCTHERTRIAAQMLAQAFAECGSLEASLTAYNSGRCGESVYARGVLRERARLLEAVR